MVRSAQNAQKRTKCTKNHKKHKKPQHAQNKVCYNHNEKSVRVHFTSSFQRNQWQQLLVPFSLKTFENLPKSIDIWYTLCYYILVRR